MMQQLILKPKEDRRIRKGHLWVFSNEVAQFPEAEPGDLVEVITSQGLSLGTAMFHPGSLITARLVGSGVQALDHDFFSQRIATAARLRERLFPTEKCYRLVHGESDFLPGLVVERFDEHLVVQTLTAGMDRRQDLICHVLEELFAPSAIVERNDTPLRQYEDLPQRTGVVRGSIPEETEIRENGVAYRVDLVHGQKTGFFLDQ